MTSHNWICRNTRDIAAFLFSAGGCRNYAIKRLYVNTSAICKIRGRKQSQWVHKPVGTVFSLCWDLWLGLIAAYSGDIWKKSFHKEQRGVLSGDHLPLTWWSLLHLRGQCAARTVKGSYFLEIMFFRNHGWFRREIPRKPRGNEDCSAETAKAEGDLSIIANEFSWRCESIDLCCWTVPPVHLDAAGAVMKKLLSGSNQNYSCTVF